MCDFIFVKCTLFLRELTTCNLYSVPACLLAHVGLNFTMFQLEDPGDTAVLSFLESRHAFVLRIIAPSRVIFGCTILGCRVMSVLYM